MSDVNANAKKKSMESAKKAQKLSPGVQYAIIAAMSHMMNGCFWGFTDVKGAMKHKEVLMKDKHIIAKKLQDEQCLIEVDPQYLLQAVMAIDPEALRKKDIEVMSEKRIKAASEFERFLKSGKLEKKAGIVGFYCVNDSTVIRYNSISYPAFRINAMTLIQLASQYGYGVVTKQGVVAADSLFAQGQAFWDNVKLSPTKTGCFIKLGKLQ